MPMTTDAAGVRGATVQDWLGTHHPQLADECDRIPGLANTIADIVEAIDEYAEHYRLDLTCFRPTASIGTSGTITVDLGAPNA